MASEICRVRMGRSDEAGFVLMVVGGVENSPEGATLVLGTHFTVVSLG